MRFISSIGTSVLVAVALSVGAAPAQAATTSTFAQFVQARPAARLFTYTNIGGGAARLQSSGGRAILQTGFGLLGSATPTIMTLDALASVSPVAGMLTTTQLFTGSLRFTLAAPQLGLTGLGVNALTVTFTDAALKASPGSAAPTLQADSSSGSLISYTSDFFDFSDAASENFALGFSGASRALVMAGGRLPNFSASGSGTFAAADPIPEPLGWALMLSGFAVIGAALRARRARVPTYG